MKNPSYQLRTALYTLLNGTISINSATVPAYDVVPRTVDFPYIRIGETYVIENSDKTHDGTTVAVDIYAVTGYEGDYGGQKDSDDISNGILLLVNSKTNPTLSGFSAYITELVSSNTLTERTETHILITNILRLRFNIQQI